MSPVLTPLSLHRACPYIAIEARVDALSVAESLGAGGHCVAEVVLRTAAAEV